MPTPQDEHAKGSGSTERTGECGAALGPSTRSAPFTLRLEEQGYPLIWPLLLRTLGMGLRPTRLLTAYFLIVALLVLTFAASAMMTKHPVGVTDTPALAVQDAFGDFYKALSDARVPHAAGLLLAMPATVAKQFPRIGLLLALPMALLVGVLGGCIARSAAVEFATGVRTSWASSMGQTLTHVRAVTLVLVGPLLLAAMLLVGASAFSWLLGVRGVGAVAGVAFGLVLGVSFLAVLLATLWIVALPLLLPAALCEGEGALDATQRAFAYVAARPLRVLGYYAVLGVLACLVLGVAWWFVRGTLGTAAWAAGNTLEASVSTDVRRALVANFAADAESPAAGSAMIRALAFWRLALLLMVPAAFVSTLLSGASAAYLLLRQAIDGRDRRVIWDPRATPREGPAFLRTLEDDASTLGSDA